MSVELVQTTIDVSFNSLQENEITKPETYQMAPALVPTRAGVLRVEYITQGSYNSR